MIRRIVLAAGLVPLLSGFAAAQSAQRFSIQGSGAVVFPTAKEPDFENYTRLGWEAQLRYTFSRFSLGAGYQRATVYKLVVEAVELTEAVSMVFIEPRYVVTAGSGVALYVAGRLGAGQLVCTPSDCTPQSTELVLGGGAGLLFRLSSRLSVDLGSQYFTTQYTLDSKGDKARAGYLLARLGSSLGL